MRSLALSVFTLLLASCTLYFHDGGDDVCNLDTTGLSDPAPLRDPENLICESFGGGCDPSCGPCPAAAELAPIPSWGACGSACEALDEASCAERSDCRVAKDLRCAVDGSCSDFLGCFPTDQIVDASIDCTSAQDGFTCSRNPGCTAFHRTDPCRGADGRAIECPRQFELCMFEGLSPGRCFDPVACDRVAPPCPAGTVPGVRDLCYSGACIPTDLCEPQPPQPAI